jgi:hypothetical protein
MLPNTEIQNATWRHKGNKGKGAWGGRDPAGDGVDSNNGDKITGKKRQSRRLNVEKDKKAKERALLAAAVGRESLQ